MQVILGHYWHSEPHAKPLNVAVHGRGHFRYLELHFHKVGGFIRDGFKKKEWSNFDAAKAEMC